MSRGTATNVFANGGNKRLSIIAEDENQAPPSVSNPKLFSTANRSHNRRWSDQPPRHSFEAPPPKYDLCDSTQQPRKRKFFGLLNSTQFTKRGGWRRFTILVLVLIAVIVGLGVGLGVGLSHRNNSSSSSSSPSPPSSLLPFPLGSYAIPAYLSSVDTSCTSNSETFSCFPGPTYNTSGTGSMVTFDWIISSPTNDTTSNLSISSSTDPFANSFASVPLTLKNKGQDDEGYSFVVPLQKVVAPNGSIGPDGAAAQCYYNNTDFQAILYTKKPYQNVPGASNNGAQGGLWKVWPYAVNVTQSIQGGKGVPECFELTKSGTGTEIPGLTPQPANARCECSWLNYDLS